MSLISVTGAHTLEAQRTITDLRLDQDHVEWIRVERSDSLFAHPNAVFLAGDLVVVTDPAAHDVVALDAASGQLKWRYLKPGRGPGEMQRPDQAAWHPDGVVVVDNGTHRLYLLSPSGDLLWEKPTPHGTFVSGVCSVQDGTLILNVASLPSHALVHFDPATGKDQVLPFPFAADDGLDAIPSAGAMTLSSQPPESSACGVVRRIY